MSLSSFLNKLNVENSIDVSLLIESLGHTPESFNAMLESGETNKSFGRALLSACNKVKTENGMLDGIVSIFNRLESGKAKLHFMVKLSPLLSKTAASKCSFKDKVEGIFSLCHKHVALMFMDPQVKASKDAHPDLYDRVACSSPLFVKTYLQSQNAEPDAIIRQAKILWSDCFSLDFKYPALTLFYLLEQADKSISNALASQWEGDFEVILDGYFKGMSAELCGFADIVKATNNAVMDNARTQRPEYYLLAVSKFYSLSNDKINSYLTRSKYDDVIVTYLNLMNITPLDIMFVDGLSDKAKSRALAVLTASA